MSLWQQVVMQKYLFLSPKKRKRVFLLWEAPCEGRSTENKLGGLSAHSPMLEDEEQRRVSASSNMQSGLLKGKFRLNCGGAILCLCCAVSAHKEAEGSGGGGRGDCDATTVFASAKAWMRWDWIISKFHLLEGGTVCWSILSILICAIIKIRALKV